MLSLMKWDMFYFCGTLIMEPSMKEETLINVQNWLMGLTQIHVAIMFQIHRQTHTCNLMLITLLVHGTVLEQMQMAQRTTQMKHLLCLTLIPNV